jgi:hypothetical protein
MLYLFYYTLRYSTEELSPCLEIVENLSTYLLGLNETSRSAQLAQGILVNYFHPQYSKPKPQVVIRRGIFVTALVA